MPHSMRTSKGPNYRSTASHPKPAAAGSRTAPSPKAAPMAMSRSHGQQGAAMKAAHKAMPKMEMPARPARPARPAKGARGAKMPKRMGR